MKIIMLGAPGQEKEHRQSRLLQNTRFLIFPPVIFSVQISKWYRVRKKAKTYMDQGALVPDELTCDLVMDRIQQDDCKTDLFWTDFQEQFHRRKL